MALASVLPALSPFSGGPSSTVCPLLLGGCCLSLLTALLRCEHATTIAMAWLGAGLASSAMALLQYFDAAGFFHPWLSPSNPGEAYANLRQRNQLATFTNISIAVLIWTRAHHGLLPRFSQSAWGIGAVSAALGSLVIGQAASASRTGFLQLISIVALAASWRSDSRTTRLSLAVAGLGVYVLAAIALPSLLLWATDAEAGDVFTRLTRSEGCESRRVLWANVLELIAQKPWTGWGWGELDYAHYVTLYERERFCAILDNAHNLPLHLAVELGVPVAVLVCTAVAWAVHRAAPWREVEPLRQLAWTVLAVIALHSMVEYPLWYAPFFTATILCTLFLWTPAGSHGAAHPRWLLGTRCMLAVALVATVLHAGHDYRIVSQLYVPSDQRSTTMREHPDAELRKLVWFRDHADFAFLTTTPLTRNNAKSMSDLATRLLHFSPEPRVIEKLAESLMLQKREDEALWHLARFRAAYPAEFDAWRAGHAAPVGSGRR